MLFLYLTWFRFSFILIPAYLPFWRIFAARENLSVGQNTRQAFLIKHCIGSFYCSGNTMQKFHFFCVPTPFGTMKVILIFHRFLLYYWNNRHPPSKYGFSGNIRVRRCFTGAVQYLIHFCSVPESRKYSTHIACALVLLLAVVTMKASNKKGVSDMTNDEMKWEMALFRFSLIAPVVAGAYQQASKMEYFRTAAAGEHNLPDGHTASFSPLTLKKWYQKYMDGGLEALIPKARIDLGTSRALSVNVRRQIVSYREKFPYITEKKIYEKLIGEGYLKKSDASINTVYQYLKAANLTKEGMSEQECLAFEFEHANDCWQADTTVGPTILADGKHWIYVNTLDKKVERLCCFFSSSSSFC